MKMIDSIKELETRAAEALKALFEQVSAIKLQNIKRESPGTGRDFDILASIDVLGHHHTLVCKVTADSQPRHVRTALQALRNDVTLLSGKATPVFIAPSLSPEAQALCRECNAGFLDLEGNVRLVLDETFIVRRSQPLRNPQPSVVPVRTRAVDRSVLRGFPPHHSASMSSASRTASYRVAG